MLIDAFNTCNKFAVRVDFSEWPAHYIEAPTVFFQNCDTHSQLHRSFKYWLVEFALQQRICYVFPYLITSNP